MEVLIIVPASEKEISCFSPYLHPTVAPSPARLVLVVSSSRAVKIKCISPTVKSEIKFVLKGRLVNEPKRWVSATIGNPPQICWSRDIFVILVVKSVLLRHQAAT